MSAPERSGQRGQILVVFTGGLVALLIIAALVVDLGFTFMIRRAEQNAADPGAIAAARHIKATGVADPTEMGRAACFYARQNGFFANATSNDGCIPANDPDGAVLTVHYPPSAQAGTFAGDYQAVEVVIARNHKSFFANVIGMTNIAVVSSAVAAFRDGPSNLSSLIALDPTGTCSTGKTHGTGDINVYPLVTGTDGGYIHINSSCSPTGTDDDACTTSGQGGLNIDGSGTVTAPQTYVVGTCKASGTLNPPGSLTEGSVVIGDPLLDLAPPSFGMPNPGAECGIGSGDFTTPTGSGSNGCKFNSAGTVTLDPGVYYGGWTSPIPMWASSSGPASTSSPEAVSSCPGRRDLVRERGPGVPAPIMFFSTDNPATERVAEQIPGSIPTECTSLTPCEWTTARTRASCCGRTGMAATRTRRLSSVARRMSTSREPSTPHRRLVKRRRWRRRPVPSTKPRSRSSRIIGRWRNVAVLDMPYDPNGALPVLNRRASSSQGRRPPDGWSWAGRWSLIGCAQARDHCRHVEASHCCVSLVWRSL